LQFKVPERLPIVSNIPALRRAARQFELQVF
jgi:hypothetical protein